MADKPDLCEQVVRARQLATHLRKVAEHDPKAFNWIVWVGPDPEAWTRVSNGESPAECGTTGCVAGWAPHALGIVRGRHEPWSDYASRLFPHMCPDWRMRVFWPADVEHLHGAEGARLAAERLEEWADENVDACADA